MDNIKIVFITNPNNIEGELKVEACRWHVQGPYKTHEFRFVKVARTVANFIVVEDVVEHWLDGDKIHESKWGHGLEEAQKDTADWKRVDKNGPNYDTKLLSHDILRYDLPCCGGKFVRTREIADYFTLSKGHCNKCKQRWEITDGHHFTVPLKVNEVDLTVTPDFANQVW